MSGFGRRVDVEILRYVLLRELEVRILLANRGTHGKVVAGAASGTKYETRRELRTSRRTDRIGLILLRCEGGKAGSREALRERATLLKTCLEVGVGNFSFFIGGTSRPFFDDVLHHRAETRLEVAVVVGKRACTERCRLAVSRSLVGSDAGIGSCARLENGSIGRQIGNALASGDGSVGGRGVRWSGGLEVSNGALDSRERISTAFTACRRESSGSGGRRRGRLFVTVLPGHTVPIALARRLGALSTSSAASGTIALRSSATVEPPSIIVVSLSRFRIGIVVTGRVRDVSPITCTRRGPRRTCIARGRDRARRVLLWCSLSASALLIIGVVGSFLVLLGGALLCLGRDFVSHVVRDEIGGVTKTRDLVGYKLFLGFVVSFESA